MVASQTASAPANLPTGTVLNFGDTTKDEKNVPEVEDQEAGRFETESDEMQELENQAHAKRVLISNDAMQHLIERCGRETDRIAFLDRIITEAKVTYPMEDGWVVLNHERMEQLVKKRQESTENDQGPAADQTVEVPDGVIEKKGLTQVGEDDDSKDEEASPAEDETQTSRTTGSLTEAMVLGNVGAVYQLIGRRPMISLAEAASELDALYRYKKGEGAEVSKLLQDQSEYLDEEQIQQAVAALTSALDGTYSSEEQAVKTALLKAVRILNK